MKPGRSPKNLPLHFALAAVTTPGLQRHRGRLAGADDDALGDGLHAAVADHLGGQLVAVILARDRSAGVAKVRVVARSGRERAVEEQLRVGGQCDRDASPVPRPCGRVRPSCPSSVHRSSAAGAAADSRRGRRPYGQSRAAVLVVGVPAARHPVGVRAVAVVVVREPRVLPRVGVRVRVPPRRVDAGERRRLRPRAGVPLLPGVRARPTSRASTTAITPTDNIFRMIGPPGARFRDPVIQNHPGT